MVTKISQKRLSDLHCVLGLDCSKYQIDIDWNKAKADGIQFAFIKITEGTTGNEDRYYNVKARALSAQKNGIKVGYYHFARPGNVLSPEQDAKDEIENVLKHLALLPKADLPLVLDIESYSAQLLWNENDKLNHMNKFVNTFFSELDAKNIKSIFYSYNNFININFALNFEKYPLWLAAYLNNPENNIPTIPKGWNDWKIWQFTEKGQISGYFGDIDLNIMKKEYFDLF